MTTQPARCPACGSTEWVVTIVAQVRGTIQGGEFWPTDGAARPPERGQPLCTRCGREYPHRLRTQQPGR